MAIAALYDIHGNLPALEAVLEEVRQLPVDELVIGGDVVCGPMSREALARLLDLQLPVHFIRGNCELAVLAEMTGEGEKRSLPEALRETVRWEATQLPGYRPVLASWPRTLRLTTAERGEVLFCHATPRDEHEVFLHSTPEEVLRPIFDATAVPLVVCGHTHMQFDRAVGATRVVNAGSVGMPFGDPGAHWLLVGKDVELRRTRFDLERAARRIRATSYPHADSFAANNVLNPPAEAKMLESLGKVALK